MSNVLSKPGVCVQCGAHGAIGSPCLAEDAGHRGRHFVPETPSAVALSDPRIGTLLEDFLVSDIHHPDRAVTTYLAYQLPIFMRSSVRFLEVDEGSAAHSDATRIGFTEGGARIAGLNHPNVVRLLKYGIDGTTRYMISEYVDKVVTLQENIALRKQETRPFLRNEVVRVLDQVLSGLAAAHELGLIHRSLRPENIFLQELPGHPTFVRVADFGLTTLEEHDPRHAPNSELCFLAPEELSGAETGPWTDLYALGCIAFEMLTLHAPHAGTPPVELADQICQGDLDPMDILLDFDLPLEQVDFLRQAIDPDASQRFRSCEAFRAALFETLQHERTHAPPSNPQPVWLAEQHGRHKGSDRPTRLDSLTPLAFLPDRETQGPARPQSLSSNALRTRIAKLEEEGNWQEAIAAKASLLERVSKSSEQYTIHMSMGDVFRARLQAPQEAALAYKKALLSRPRERGPLLQLLQLASVAEDYPTCIRHLKDLVALEADPSRKATYCMSVAVIYRDRLQDPMRAVEFFEAALEADPSRMRAFTAIASLLHGRAPHRFEQCIKRMILRIRNAPQPIEGATNILFGLYRDLGHLFEHGLVEPARAIEAFETALKLRPLDKEVLDRFVALCIQQGKYAQAAERCRLRIKTLRDDFEGYRRLIMLSRKAGDTDRAWLVSGLLCALGQTDSQEAKSYAAYRPIPVDSHPVWDPDIWAQVVVGPPGIPRLGPIFQILYEALGHNFRTDSIRRYGVSAKQRMDVDDSPGVKHLHQIARVMGCMVPDVYLDNKVRGMEILPVLPLAIRMDDEALRLAGTAKGSFLLSKVLTYLHPWHVLGTLYDDGHLALLLQAAFKIAVPSFQAPLPAELHQMPKRTASKKLNALVQALERELDASQRAELIEILSPMAKAGGFPDISAWRRLVELTTNHVGTVIAGDVNLVAGLLRSEDSGCSFLTVDERLKDLVLWVLSHRFREIRRRLKLGPLPAQG